MDTKHEIEEQEKIHTKNTRNNKKLRNINIQY